MDSRIAKRISLIASTVLLVGCQAMMYGTAKDMDKVHPGMTCDEVVATLGEPYTVGSDAASEETHFFYKKMDRVAGWSPTNYDVTLKNNKVVRVSEAK